MKRKKNKDIKYFYILSGNKEFKEKLEEGGIETNSLYLLIIEKRSKIGEMIIKEFKKENKLNGK